MQAHIRRPSMAAFLVAVTLSLLPLASPAAEPGTAIVSLYRIEAGKQGEFLKWQAARDAVDKEAGITQGQWYAHTNGDSWDYLSIAPVLTEAQQKKVDDVSRTKGLSTGFKASLEFRQYIGSHTDTYVVGPMTATELSAMAAR
ncbi:MAG TPA: hypothetical protein VFS55_10790 [Dokdonella sp.]|nr:hypothetical protein [Dokdonella sp.]